MLKKEWLLMLVSVSVTLFLALGLVRWLAPQLLGVPTDLQLVKVQEEMQPYFDVVFQKGNLVAGVLSVKEKELAVKAAVEMFNQLS